MKSNVQHWIHNNVIINSFFNTNTTLNEIKSTTLNTTLWLEWLEVITVYWSLIRMVPNLRGPFDSGRTLRPPFTCSVVKTSLLFVWKSGYHCSTSTWSLSVATGITNLPITSSVSYLLWSQTWIFINDFSGSSMSLHEVLSEQQQEERWCLHRKVFTPEGIKLLIDDPCSYKSVI